jgi:hypothetical protein
MLPNGGRECGACGGAASTGGRADIWPRLGSAMHMTSSPPNHPHSHPQPQPHSYPRPLPHSTQPHHLPHPHLHSPHILFLTSFSAILRRAGMVSSGSPRRRAHGWRGRTSVAIRPFPRQVAVPGLFGTRYTVDAQRRSSAKPSQRPQGVPVVGHKHESHLTLHDWASASP